MRSARIILASIAFLGACHTAHVGQAPESAGLAENPYLIVLGVAQDAGFPQAACEQACCRAVHSGGREPQGVVSLGLVDPKTGGLFMFECTPDFPEQWRRLQSELGEPVDRAVPDGLFITHAHIGHYTGLVHLGHEVIGAQGVPVHAMPRMAEFLRTQGPWSQLVEFGNIELIELEARVERRIEGTQIRVRPILVPHRDEFSETVGFVISGPRFSALFLPDIDKWSRWERDLARVLAEVDVAYLDGTFFKDGEIPGRDMASIAHPFVTETIELLRDLPERERAKVRFIHLNHTNPLLWSKAARREVEREGFRVAQVGERVPL